MFKVVFKKQVHSCCSSMSSTDVYLHRVVELPFVPPRLMEVIDGDWSATVDKLCSVNGVVYAFTSPDTELYDAGLHGGPGKPRLLSEIVQDWVDSGWEVSKGILG